MYRYCDARLNMISDYRKVIFLMLQSVSVFAHLFFFHAWLRYCANISKSFAIAIPSITSVEVFSQPTMGWVSSAIPSVANAYLFIYQANKMS